VKFLLATTDPQKLPMTVAVAVLQFSLKRLSANLIGERLKFIASEESWRSSRPRSHCSRAPRRAACAMP